jgi:pimeloyl-ACP methyl ester carboxylesterase
MYRIQVNLRLYRIFILIVLVMVLCVTEVYGWYSLQHTVPLPVTETYAQVRDAKIAYYTVGSGEPLLLHAGFGMSMQDWDPMLIERLSNSYKLIIFDSRGVGKSGGDISRLSLSQMAADSVGLLDALGIQKAHMLGWSMGSMVVQEVAISYPDRVDKIVLIATDPGGSKIVEPDASVDAFAAKHIAEPLIPGFLPLLFPETPQGEQAAKSYMSRRSLAIAQKNVPLDYDVSFDTKQAQQFMMADRKANEARYTNLQEIKTPTLVLGGTNDVMLPVENSQATASLIQHSQYIGIEDAGHALLFQKPVYIADIVHRFLHQP